MPTYIRNVPGAGHRTDMWQALLSLQLKLAFSIQGFPAIGDGTTSGTLRTTAATPYTVAGAVYSKASTDDLWDLSAEVDTAAATYRAYWLYLDSAGAASIVAGSDVPTEAQALASLPLPADDQSVAGVYVAGPSCDFDGVAGLEAQGTVYDGIPEGANIGVLDAKNYQALGAIQITPA